MAIECPMCFKEFKEDEIVLHASSCLDENDESYEGDSTVKIEEEVEIFNFEKEEEKKAVEVEEEKKEEYEEILELKNDKLSEEKHIKEEKEEVLEKKKEEIEEVVNNVVVVLDENEEKKKEEPILDEENKNEIEESLEVLEEKNKKSQEELQNIFKEIDDITSKKEEEEDIELVESSHSQDESKSEKSASESEQQKKDEFQKSDIIILGEPEERKVEPRKKKKKEKPEETKRRRDSRSIKKAPSLTDHSSSVKLRVGRKRGKTIGGELKEKTDPSMLECQNCQSYFLPSQLHTLELCSHSYCITCLRAGLRDIITGKTTREPVCVVCQTSFTNNDIIAIYNPRKYQRYQQKTLELLEGVRLSPSTVCNKCGKPVKFERRLFILPEITDQNYRQQFMSSPAKSIDRILYRAEHTCKMACKKCETEVCIICGKESGGEFAHPPIFCPMVFSIMIAEVLDCLKFLASQYYGVTLQLPKKDNDEQSSSEAKKASSSSESKAAKGVGFDGSVSDNYSGVSIAHQKETQQSTVIRNLLDLLSGIITSSAYVNHPSLFPLVYNSCLIPLLMLYFRNDWLMDVTQQGELYFSVLALLRALSAHPVLACVFIYPFSLDSEACLMDSVTTLAKQASFVTKQAKNFVGKENSTVLGLALEIQSTVTSIEEGIAAWKSSKVVSHYSPLKPKEDNPGDGSSPNVSKSRASRIFKRKSTLRKIKEEKIVILDDPKKRDEFYLQYLKNYQFEFMSPYPKSLQNVRYTSEYLTVLGQSVLSPDVMIRLSQELSSLAASLPLSPSSGIFMRVNEEKINLMRFIIIGPEDTPYANGCFEFEMVVGGLYPTKPPAVQLMTTGAGTVRFNPNLYDTGKVCLSLLGTWSGPGWDPKLSTLLQVLVSIQSLILVPDPYFNEPGYERDMGTELGKSRSKAYNANIRLHNIRLAMVDQLKTPTPGFEDVIRTHFYLRKEEILKQTQVWVNDNPTQQMKDAFDALKKELAALSPPSGVKVANEKV